MGPKKKDTLEERAHCKRKTSHLNQCVIKAIILFVVRTWQTISFKIYTLLISIILFFHLYNDQTFLNWFLGLLFITWKEQTLAEEKTLERKPRLEPTAFSRCQRARSRFFVWANKMFPNCRCVLDSIRGGGLKLKIDCRQWIHSRILGGLDVRNVSARPKRETYHGSASTTDAILVVGIFGADYVNFLSGKKTDKKKLLLPDNCLQPYFIFNYLKIMYKSKLLKKRKILKKTFTADRILFINTIGWWQFCAWLF